MAKSVKPFYIGTQVAIDKPLAGTEPTLNDGGTVHVQATRIGTGTAFAKIYAKILNDADPIPSSLPDDAVELNQIGSTHTFEHFHVPVATGLQTPSGNDNKVVAWPANDPNDLGTPHAVSFPVRVPSAPFTVDVSARQSIWFAWAPRDYPTTAFGEESHLYCPVQLVVPQDAGLNGARISANSSHEWTHRMQSASTRSSDADGLDDTRPMERPDVYKVAALRSDNISGSDLELNRLVGMWGIDHTQACSEFSIGLGGGSFSFPGGTRPRLLFLGFHDGFEWSNNSGSVSVTVEWE